MAKSISHHADGSLPENDIDLIAEQIAGYYDWLIDDKTGIGPDELLQYPHTTAQRKLLLARMDDVLVVVSGLRELKSKTDVAVERHDLVRCLQNLLIDKASKTTTSRRRTRRN